MITKKQLDELPSSINQIIVRAFYFRKHGIPSDISMENFVKIGEGKNAKWFDSGEYSSMNNQDMMNYLNYYIKKDTIPKYYIVLRDKKGKDYGFDDLYPELRGYSTKISCKTTTRKTARKTTRRVRRA